MNTILVVDWVNQTVNAVPEDFALESMLALTASGNAQGITYFKLGIPAGCTVGKRECSISKLLHWNPTEYLRMKGL